MEKINGNKKKNDVIPVKDTLKAFDDFKSKSKKVYEVMFLTCKSMYILKVYSIHYNTLR